LFLLNFSAGGASAARSARDKNDSLRHPNDAAHIQSNAESSMTNCNRPSQFCNRSVGGRDAPVVSRAGQETAKGRLAENHRHFRFAEGLGSDWRFFTTYAGV